MEGGRSTVININLGNTVALNLTLVHLSIAKLSTQEMKAGKVFDDRKWKAPTAQMSRPD